jgi:hypothetical protein
LKLGQEMELNVDEPFIFIQKKLRYLDFNDILSLNIYILKLTFDINSVTSIFYVLKNYLYFNLHVIKKYYTYFVS